MPINSSHSNKLSHDLLEEIELLDPLKGELMRLHFDGPFEQSMVHWNATLFTPAAWATQFNETIPEQNIIEIHENIDGEFKLSVCLKVKCFDRPTIRKAVMMIRQYKRLARGRHEYG